MITDNFISAVGRFYNKVAVESYIYDKKESLTYGQLYKNVESLAFFLSSLGIKKSDKIAIILDNRPEWPIIFFAIFYMGAVAVPIYSRLPHKDTENILYNSGAKLAFISKEDVELYKFLKGIAQIQEIITVPFSTYKDAPKGVTAVDVEPDDLAVLLYTSGTTDEPKGVMLTHRNLCANFNSLKRLNLFSHKDSILSVLPLYHSYPLMCTLIVPILSGARIVYCPADWPDKLIDYLKEARISIFVGVPQIFHMMHTKIMKELNALPVGIKLYIKFATGIGLTWLLLPKLHNLFGKRFRFFASGGAKLDEIVAKDFLKIGFKILEGYGLTETSPVVTFNTFRRPRIGSCGKAIPDVQLKILNKDVDGIGEIAIKGPNVMKGYYKDEAKTKIVFKDEWFLSGDLGYIDRGGYLYITGRSKEIIVLSSGKNIYPEEIERHYSKAGFVKEMCVLGVLKQKGAGKIEYLHAIVVPDLTFFKERGEMNIRDVIKNIFENLSKELPSYKRIMGFTVTQESLPRTILGKIKRYEVEKKFLPIILEDEHKKEEVLTEEDKKLIESDIGKNVIKCIEEALHIKATIHLNDSIELDLGVDSLGRVELLCAMEKYFKVEVPEEMVASEIFTVRDLILKVQEILGKDVGNAYACSTRPLWPEILKQSLSFELQKKILLYPTWLDYIFTFVIKTIVVLFFRIFYNLRVEGVSNIPKKGPYILCVNHTSFFDGFIVMAAVPFKIGLDLFFIGFRRYFIVPIVRSFVSRARIIPIDATQIVEAMQASYFVLSRNKILCIFPEGGRSIDGEVKDLKKGVGIIAKELDIPLVPVIIKGAFEAWPRTQRLPRIYPIKIRFGKPINPGVLIEKGMALGAGDGYEALSLALREELIKIETT